MQTALGELPNLHLRTRVRFPASPPQKNDPACAPDLFLSGGNRSGNREEERSSDGSRHQVVQVAITSGPVHRIFLSGGNRSGNRDEQQSKLLRRIPASGSPSCDRLRPANCRSLKSFLTQKFGINFRCQRLGIIRTNDNSCPLGIRQFQYKNVLPASPN